MALKVERKFGNIYDNYYNYFKTGLEKDPDNSLFTEEGWQNASGKGTLNEYISIIKNSSDLANFNKIEDVKSFKDDWGWDFLDEDEKLSAMYYEQFYKNDTEKKTHKKNTYTENGNLIIDSEGNPVQKDYEISDYDYYKGIFKEAAEARKKEEQIAMEQTIKDQGNKFVQGLNSIVGLAGSLVSSTINQVENILLFPATALSSLIVTSTTKPEAFWGSLLSFMLDPLNLTGLANKDYAKTLETLSFSNKDDLGLIGDQISQDIIDFQSENTLLRNANGEYTHWTAQVLDQSIQTIGQMLPTMFLGPAATPVMYWGFGTQTAREDYEYFKSHNIDVSTQQVMFNAGVKMAFQWAVEELLSLGIKGLTKGKFGTTKMDQIFRNKSASVTTNVVEKVTKGTLIKRGFTKFAMDAFQEGLEEVLQDLSDRHVDGIFANIVNEDFGILYGEGGPSQITAKDLGLTFVTSMLTSVISSSVGMIFSKKNVVGYKVDDKGNIKETKLHGFANYGYNITLQSMLENCKQIIDYAKNNKEALNKDSKMALNYRKAFANMYGALQTLASLYSSYSAEDMKRTETLLGQVNKYLNDYSLSSPVYYATKAKELVGTLSNVQLKLKLKVTTDLIDKLKSAKMTDTKYEITKEELEDDLKNISKNVSESNAEYEEEDVKKLRELLKDNSGLENIIVTRDGINIVLDEESNTLFVPERLFETSSSIDLINSTAKERIIDDLLKSKFFTISSNKKLFESIKETFKNYYSYYDENTSLRNALSFLLNDEAFAEQIIFGNLNNDTAGTKDIHNFILSLISYLDNYDSNNTLLDNVTKNELEKSIKMLTNNLVIYYSVLSSNRAEINKLIHFSTKEGKSLLTKDQISYIIKNSYSKLLLDKLREGTSLTSNDIYAIKKLINNMQISDAEKLKLTLSLDEFAERKITDPSLAIKTFNDIINRLQKYYTTLFSSKYDDNTYLKPISDGARAFNYFLKQQGLTVDIIRRNPELLKKFNNKQYKAVLENDRITIEYKGKISQSTKQEATLPKITILADDKDFLLSQGFVDQKIDKATQASMTINDIIENPDLLAEDFKNTIAIQNGVKINQITSDMIFIAINKALEYSRGGWCVVYNPSEGYSLAKTKSITDVFDVNKVNAIFRRANLLGKSRALLKNLFGNYFRGLDSDTEIIFIKDKDMTANGYADPIKNQIVINLDKTNTSEKLLLTLTHETEHIMQYWQGMYSGSSRTFMTDIYYALNSDNQIDFYNFCYEIKKDILKHHPEWKSLFKNENYLISDLNNLFYEHCYGEQLANGQIYLDYKPFVIIDKKVVTPWGAIYDFTSIKYQKGATIKLNDISNAKSTGLNIITKKLQTTENKLQSKTTKYSKNEEKINNSDTVILKNSKRISMTEIFDSNTSHNILIDSNGTLYDTTLTKSEINSNEVFKKQKPILISTINGMVFIDIKNEKNIFTEDSVDSLLSFMEICAEKQVKVMLSIDEIRLLSSDLKEFNTNTVLNMFKVIACNKVNNFTSNFNSMSMSEDKKKYVSTKKQKGTLAEQFGYVGKYNYNKMSTGELNFVNNANKIKESNPDLYEIVAKKEKVSTKGELNDLGYVKNEGISRQQIMDYFQKTDLQKLDQNTFDLINSSFFHNKHITSPEQLQKKINDSQKLYALYGALKAADINLEGLEIGSSVVENITRDLLYKDDSFKNNYNKIMNAWDYFLKTDEKTGKKYLIPVDINDNYLKYLYMKYYDGTIESVRAVIGRARQAAINGWKVRGDYSKAKEVSTETEIGEDITLGDTLADESSDPAEIYANTVYIDESRKNKVDEIMKVFSPSFVQDLLKKGKGKNFILQELLNERERFSQMSEEEFAKEYNKIVNNKNEADINKQFEAAIIAETNNIKVDKMTNEEIDRLEQIAQKELERPEKAVRENIRQKLITIDKFKVNYKDTVESFLSKQKYLDENGKLKKDLTYEELLKIEQRLQERIDKWRAEEHLLIENKKLQEKLMQAEQDKKDLNSRLKRAEAEAAKKGENIKPKEIKVVTVEVRNKIVHIALDKNKKLPKVIKKLLEKPFERMGKTNVKYLSKDSDEHTISQLYELFIKDNSETLLKLTQQEVNELYDFLINSQVILGDEAERQYFTVIANLSTFLMEHAFDKRYDWSLNEEQAEKLRQKFVSMESMSGTALALLGNAAKRFAPEESIGNKFAKELGIEYKDIKKDIKAVVDAVAKGDVEAINLAKQKLYENALEQYKGVNKVGFLDKLLQWERLMMLTSPGTWIRNLFTNKSLDLGNKFNEKSGEWASKLLNKLFPKLGTKIDKLSETQYKIIGTPVNEETKNFIQKFVVDNNLLSIISDGLSKYDVATVEKESGDYDISKMIITGIKREILNNPNNTKLSNWFSSIIAKMMSDEKAINKRVLYYLGKTLTEDNVDLSKGLSKDVLNHIVEAYILAANEFMHKTTIISKIENIIQQKSPKAYFIWKQIAPFANATWNWFVEGLKYTPLGLAKSIVNYAKLEKTIERLDKQRAEGNMTYSSKFAKYMSIKDLGKGVIGTIGTLIGVILAASGLAGIDEEDDKYKLKIGSVAIDITDLFGSQGILMGITMLSNLKDGKGLWKATTETINMLFDDSLYTTFYDLFRYNSGFSDFALYIPYNTMNMIIPNFWKTFTSIISKYKVNYSSGIEGKFERWLAQIITTYPFAHKVDIYSGEDKVTYKMWLGINLINKLSTVDIQPYNVSKLEKTVISYGLKKNNLTGKYTINDKEITLDKKTVEKLNKYYGQLNEKTLNAFINGSKKYSVKQSDGSYKELYYSQMTNEQRKSTINSIMSQNSNYSKIYILTSTGKYSYYATESMYQELKKLGITTNVYREKTVQGKKISGYV